MLEISAVRVIKCEQLRNNTGKLFEYSQIDIFSSELCRVDACEVSQVTASHSGVTGKVVGTAKSATKSFQS